MRKRSAVWLSGILSGCLVTGLSGCGKRTLKLEASSQTSDPAHVQAAEGGSGTYRFPEGPDGKLLAVLLVPSEKLQADETENRAEPRRLPTSPTLEVPGLPLSANSAELPRLPLSPLATPIRPEPLPEEPPLSRSIFDPAIPERRELPAGQGVRVSSPDVNQPLPPPILAEPQTSRASLDDPTAEASAGLALLASMPDRTNPAPFLRLDLPDPFENSRVVRLRTTPPEDGISLGR